MPRRHHLAVMAYEIPHTATELINALYEAGVECEVYNIDPRFDAAVQLLTHQLHFQLHSDMLNAQNLEHLLTHCRYERNKGNPRCPAAH